MATETSQDSTHVLRLMGKFSLFSDKSGEFRLANRKACALLGYLALKQESYETRERLAGLLWSGFPEEQARASLRQCLRYLQTALTQAGFNGLWRDRTHIGLEQRNLDTDVRKTLSQIRNGCVEDGMVTGDAMPETIFYGFESVDPAFAAWLAVTRQSWHDIFISELESVLAAANTPPREAHAAATSIIQLDPTHEKARRLLMRQAAENGNVGAALKHYQILWDILDREYDLEPDIETQELVAAIKLGHFERSPSAPPQPIAALNTPSSRTPPQKPDPQVGSDRGTPGAASTPFETASPASPIIRVLPFENTGPSREHDYIAIGFRRDLVATLIRFREWVVIETDGVAGPRPVAPATSTERMLYELAGTYSEFGHGFQLVFTLKDIESSRYIWSEKLSLSKQNWYAVQQEIASRLAMSLNHYLSSHRLARIARQPTLPAEVHDRWLIGNQLTQYWTSENEAKAEEIFRSITKEVPRFSRAFSSLATLYNTRHLRNPGVARNKNLEDEALRLAQTALGLDSLDTRNQAVVAWSYLMHQRFELAELHFDLTYELNPSSPQILIPCAHGLNYCGRHDQARDMAETAIRQAELLPRFHWGYIMCIRFFLGDFKGCLEASDLAGDVITDLLGWRAAALGLLGRQEEAAEAARRFKTLAHARWRGDGPASDQAIVSWFKGCFPIRKEEDRKLLREGLRLAGLPAAEIQNGDYGPQWLRV
ncbi:MAG: hypothetical protein NXI16_04465 [Alphaproteobacteria bacterium]|nr:hypothetical protein [Alphaproteobacteria bacterium]